MAGMRDQSAKALGTDHLDQVLDGSGGGRPGRRTDSMLTGIDFPENVDRLRETAGDPDVVQRDGEAPDAFGDPGEPVELRLADRGMGDQQVIDAGGSKDLRL